MNEVERSVSSSTTSVSVDLRRSIQSIYRTLLLHTATLLKTPSYAVFWHVHLRDLPVLTYFDLSPLVAFGVMHSAICPPHPSVDVMLDISTTSDVTSLYISNPSEETCWKVLLDMA